MNRCQKPLKRIVRDPACRQSIQRLEEAMARAQTTRSYLDQMEDLKLTQARLRLFGCAPK